MACFETGDIVKDIKKRIEDYGYDDVSGMVIALAVERFKDLRNYPGTWMDYEIEADIRKNMNKIAMAAIEIDSKVGAEGQTQMTENGISRTWTSRISAYNDVVGFAQT